MIKLRYGNTNTFLLCGEAANLLIDTDYAGTLPACYKEIKKHGINVRDITYVMATHYHPDHIGLISELMEHGVKLLLLDTQTGYVHFSDEIFSREKRLKYIPISESQATVINCSDSRAFLRSMGINGEIISTPSHSEDSVSLILDDGNCIVGDLEPVEFLGAYEDNPSLEKDWSRIMSYKPKKIFYAHANEKIMMWCDEYPASQDLKEAKTMGKDMCVPCESGLINLRVGAIIMKDGKILMAGSKRSPEYLYSVGGRIQFGETAEEAVRREVREETGVDMEVDRLGFVHENYFYGDVPANMGKLIYEISFYFYMKVPPNFAPVCGSFTEDGQKEFLHWVPVDTPVPYYPGFFRTELLAPSREVKYFLNDERQRPDFSGRGTA